MKTYIVKVPEESELNLTKKCIVIDAPLSECTIKRVVEAYSLYDVHQAREEAQTKIWELAKKLILNPCDGGLSQQQTQEIFGKGKTLYDVLKYLNASEAVRLYSNWLERHDGNVKVGDVVTYTNDGDYVVTGFITMIEGDYVDILCKGGYTTFKNRNEVVKTGESILFGDKGFDISEWLEEE